ncbi:DUF4097 and DUF4098 domain-containing protein YvlB [Kribbella sp. VKM Ac-2527]|uniref:DUF4097 and DUF4098 domain-containing protein YvlB n=1 Tax=Kribbella caucasensis TaxID=2512215 RepID=A0A4R6KQC5_9ACTN|nr:DUF4097 family beta strand repeat-containing protein [Kribbella sp. VKM Ac-2527]TDO54579.1 DUF4097 and DUF4098 domain-containing protein YvlB [Kribbella sp. VKM Ac-2527]
MSRDFVSNELVDDIDRLRIEIGSGLVEIVPSDGPQTTATLEVDGSGAEEIVFKVSDGELIVDGPRTSRRGPDITVRIATPATLDVRIKTGSGDISSRMPLGESRLATGSGDISLTAVEGILGATTGSGDIRVEHAAKALSATTGSGSIDIASAAAALGLSTGSGDVRVGDVTGPTTIKVGSGDITVERIRDHSVATSGSGDVRVELADGPSLRTETARGDVHIGVPDGVPTYLDLKTVTGHIECDLEPSQRPADGERTLRLRARTVSGDITVAKV